MKKKHMGVFLGLILVTLLPVASVKAETPYKTYTVDGYGYVMETQSAYTPMSAITKVGETTLVTPTDMCLSKSGRLYIADAGGRVVLVTNRAGEELGRIGEGELKAPTGVYVTEDEKIYVADKEAKKVIVFDANGTKLAEYGKPTSPIYGVSMDFKPTKIVANKTGTMYVICEGNMNGIIQLSPVDQGSFLGYFGTNYTSLNPFQILQRVILTDEQRAQMLSNIPSTPTNLAMDDKGLIYTVTQGDGNMSLKKLNIAGNNLLQEDMYYADLPAALTVGQYNNILVADSDGYVYEYNEDGGLLFMFGGRDDGRQRIGLCNKVEAIAVDDEDRIYLLDSDKKQIHIFEPTEFTNLLHQSLSLYSKGRYEESKEPLSRVLQMNSMFDYANQAMGRAYLQEENYDGALQYFKIAKDFDGYSDAYWEVRNLWIRKNIVKAVGILILIVVAIECIKKEKKKGKLQWITQRTNFLAQNTLCQQLKYSFYYMKHPLDGCYGVKREQKASYLCANLLVGGYIVVSVLEKYFCGFLIRSVREGRYDLATDIGKIIVIFLALIACNYLVVTINDGEAFFRQLYCAYAYCLTPFLIMKPLVLLTSNVLTYNEVFIVQFMNVIAWVWFLVLLVLTMKEINNYTVHETVRSIFITAFTVLIMVLLVFVIYALFSQVIDFVITVIREAVYRIGN